MNRIKAAIIVFLLISRFGYSQGKKTSISFNYYTHDFGTIKEEGGLQSYDFVFTNIGNSPLIVKNVQASCGCTVPEWSKEAVLPDNTGTIKVEFNPINKPGPFNKSLTVITNALNESVILYVTGKVIPKARKPSDEYPDLNGNLRMISRYMNLGEITNEKLITKEFVIYNQSDTAITIQPLNYSSTFLSIKFASQILAPKSKTKIEIIYDPAKKNDFGYVQDKIEFITDDKIMPVKSIYVTGTITKYFHKYSEDELKSQPKIQIDKMMHDFGIVKQGEKLTTIFTISNVGKGDLTIYKIKPSCGCTITNIDKKVIGSGESGKLTITFDTQGKEGIQEKHVNIYTNDPINFNPVITLKAKIQRN